MLILQPDDPQVASLLAAGKIGVIPTDTIYGLSCRADDPAAVQRLYRLKDREGKPGTLIAASVDQLTSLGIVVIDGVEGFWPGSVSIILPVTNGLDYLTQGRPDTACRVIGKPPELLNTVRIAGSLLTSSANLPGQPPATNITEARVYFGDSVDFYVDGGMLTDSQPSTIIRIVQEHIEVLRHGAVTIEPKERS